MMKLKAIIVSVILCCSTQASAQLRITKADLLGLGQFAISGVLWGAHEAYQADNYVFEKKGFKGNFFAHDAWKNKYRDRNPENGIKSEFLFGNTFRDVDHFTGTFNSTFAVGGTATICLQKHGTWKHKAVKVLAGVLVRSFCASVTYRVLRK